MPPVPADPIAEWMLEVTKAMEKNSGRLDAVEKSVDQNTTAVGNAVVAAGAASTALVRIAKAEEDRLAYEKEADKARGALLERFLSNKIVQLLILGVVVAFMNTLGVGYIAQQLLPVPQGAIVVTTPPGEPKP